MTKGYRWGVVMHVHAVGMDGQQVLGLQGVGDCACDQGGGEHDGFVSGGYREQLIGSFWSVAGHHEKGLQVG